MDCIEAQSVISEALDRSPVDAGLLEDAKAHCRECAQCGQYVRALNAIRRATPPRPPDDLTSRIMETIRAEAAAAAAASAGLAKVDDALTLAETPEASGEAHDGPIPGEDMPATSEPPSAYATAMASIDTLGASATPPPGQHVSFGRGRMDRSQLIAWGSAAAVLLVIVGVSAGLGMMRLVNRAGSPATATRSAQSAAVESAPGTVTDKSVLGGAAGSAESTAAVTASPAPANLYVVFGGNVYVAQGMSSQAKDELTVAGQTLMTFSADVAPTTHSVYLGSETGAIYIESAPDTLQRFALVKRTYQGSEYRLRSGDISEYGTWPSLPPGIPQPVPENNPAGTPAFVLDGRDASATSVYRRVGTDRRSGIAIAPGSSAGDAAGGNPNWTWWTP